MRTTAEGSVAVAAVTVGPVGLVVLMALAILVRGGLVDEPTALVEIEDDDVLFSEVDSKGGKSATRQVMSKRRARTPVSSCWEKVQV